MNDDVRDVSHRHPWNQRVTIFTIILGGMFFTQVMASCYSRTIISTLEVRYGTTAEFAGNISMCYSAGAILCYIMLFFTDKFFKQNRPRYLAIFHYIATLGSFILPWVHFLSGTYDHTKSLNRESSTQEKKNSQIQYVCTNVSIETVCAAETTDSTFDVITSDYYLTYAFYIAEFLMGFGVSVIWPLGYTFIDDYAMPGKSTFYYSVISAILMFGWGTSFTLSSKFADTWLYWPDRAPTGLDPENTNEWVGAWWMGYVVFTVLNILAGLPMLTFPAEIPAQYELSPTAKARKEQEALEREASENYVDEKSRIERFNNLPLDKKIMRILGNKCTLCVISSEILDGYAGQFGFFLPKYMERMWEMKLSAATMISAYRAPISSASVILGGLFFTRVVKLNAHTAKKWIVWCQWIIYIIFATKIFIGCPNKEISGVDLMGLDNFDGKLSSDKVEDCNCLEGRYDRVCTEDNQVEYITACYAGCKNFTEKTEYDEKTNKNSTYMIYHNCVDGTKDASEIYCKTPDQIQEDCTAGVMVLFALTTLAGTIGTFFSGPTTMVTVGTAPPEEKVLTLAFYKFSGKFLSQLWAAKIVGKIIDATCVLQFINDCDEVKNCLLYDKLKMRYYMFGFSNTLIFLGTVAISGVLFFKPRKHSPAWVALEEEKKEQAMLEPSYGEEKPLQTSK